MEKYFDEIATTIMSEAVTSLENEEKNFGYVIHTPKYDVDCFVELDKGVYEITEVIIYNEDGEDVTGRFPLFIEEMKELAPTLDEVKEKAEDDWLSCQDMTTQVFGSEAGYRRWRYGR